MALFWCILIAENAATERAVTARRAKTLPLCCVPVATACRLSARGEGGHGGSRGGWAWVGLVVWDARAHVRGGEAGDVDERHDLLFRESGLVVEVVGEPGAEAEEPGAVHLVHRVVEVCHRPDRPIR